MDETYRMLGREHQADLEREAQRRELAAAVRAAPAPRPASTKPRRREWPGPVVSRLARLLAVLAFVGAAALLLGARPAPEPAEPSAAVTKQRSLDAYAKLPLSFIPNAGQTDARVRFYAQGSGYGFYFTSQAAVLAFTKRVEGKEKAVALHLRFTGANPAPTIEGVQTGTGTVNHFVGRDRAKWQTGLPTYYAVAYRDLWPGIDMLFRGRDGKLKYEFRLAPGADPSNIRLAYAGAESLSVSAAGSLLIDTSLGALQDSRPVARQRIGGRNVPVESRYALGRGGGSEPRFGFALRAHDSHYPLVIDPGLKYSTYLGGPVGGDFGTGIAVDKDGNAYITGRADSAAFPTTAGAYDPTFNGVSDAFVAKLNSTGSALLYSTYLGGSAFDVGFSIDLDRHGGAYVTGRTDSSDFPTTPGSFQPSDPNPAAGASGRDGYVTKLSASGSALVYSTYLGGTTDRDQGNGIDVDADGNAYVTGSTRSTNFPTTPGAFQAADPDPVAGLAGTDSFVTKLNQSGSALRYSTYLGGIGSDVSGFSTIRVDDEDGSAYVAGVTGSSNFPTTPGSFQDEDPAPAPGFSCDLALTDPGPGCDVFVTKLKPSGKALSYSTYLGGHGADGVFQGTLALDEEGHAYITGDTGSDDFPTTPGSFQDVDPSPGPCAIFEDDEGPGCDGFVTKFNRSGSALVYSSYLGASGTELGSAIDVGKDGRAVVAGVTESSDFPTTPGAFDTTLSGLDDVFVLKLDAAGSALIYSTYLGGDDGIDFNPNGLALDTEGSAYVTGPTTSTNFPTTPGAFQEGDPGPGPFPSGLDGFVTKLVLDG